MAATGSSASVAVSPGATGAAAASVPASRFERRALLLSAAGLLVLYWPTVAWLFDRWTMSVWHHAHGLLIPPVVAYFIYQELHGRPDLPYSSSALGFLFVVPALALRALDAGMHTELLSAVSLVILLPGLSLLFVGVRRTRVIAFPLVFLAFALPIPLALTESIHWELRQIATAASAFLIPLIGTPVFVEGTTVHLPNGVVQISDACSGFSTLYASVAIAFLTAYSASGTGRRLLVLASAVPLAIGANILRVVGLILLVEHVGPWILDTFVHPLSGMLTFALALPIILWLGATGPRTGS